MATLFPRLVQTQLEESLETFPATLIHGPRQCGKSTLARVVGQAAGYDYISMDDARNLEYAQRDPVGFVNSLPDKVILDEIQKVPKLFSQIKFVIDENRVDGRFILTGSVSIMHVRGLSDSLAGRVGITRMHPLAQTELAQTKPHFLDALFSADFQNSWQEAACGPMPEQIVAGGYPAALKYTRKGQRIKWYNSYLTTIANTDAFTISRIRSIEKLPQILKFAAAYTANILSINNVASSFQMNKLTVDHYITLLEHLFLLERLPAWRSNRLKRLVQRPKLHLTDTGLACALLDVGVPELTKDRALLGQLLETFVLQELKRQDDERHNFFHYRSRDRSEVDIVIERSAQSVAGVEVKAAETITHADFRGLQHLQAAAGESFRCGVVLYAGGDTRSYGDKLFAVPIKRLWEQS